YFDYYQFVSHRTVTSITEQQLEDYLANTMGIIGKPVSYQDDDKDSADDTRTRSQYYGELPAFWQYQYEYGANSLMMFALSENESANGSSALCYSRNNLFGHAAYDSDVEANASRYLNISNSIYSHARYYISGSYASPLKSMFRGSFFGNKSAGMNVSYASDPYWGEKAAVYYRHLDESFDSIDLNQYTLGIKTSSDMVDVYQYPQADSGILYTTRKNPDYSFVILSAFSNEDGDWYAVQSEATLDENSKVALSYYYDYSNDIGYILQSDIQTVIAGKKTEEPSYVHVTFDAAGGVFSGNEGSVTYALPTGTTASASTPVKDHALFTGWDHPLDNIAED
ncbi:MAG: cell wall-binding protein, partial [Erysipelotrichia bacterium]|nr:cell wall-binding protein [Erysipelotrichia bacterium]